MTRYQPKPMKTRLTTTCLMTSVTSRVVTPSRTTTTMQTSLAHSLSQMISRSTLSRLRHLTHLKVYTEPTVLTCLTPRNPVIFWHMMQRAHIPHTPRYKTQSQPQTSPTTFPDARKTLPKARMTMHIICYKETSWYKKKPQPRQTKTILTHQSPPKYSGYAYFTLASIRTTKRTPLVL